MSSCTSSFVCWATRLGTASPLPPTQVPKLLNCGLRIRFCQTARRPLLALDRSPGSHGLGCPPGSDSRRSARAYSQTNGFVRRLSATAANNSGHVSPSALLSSPAVAANTSALSSRFAWATPAAATNCPSCELAHSTLARPQASGESLHVCKGGLANLPLPFDGEQAWLEVLGLADPPHPVHFLLSHWTLVQRVKRGCQIGL
jgi:hypothetical protein